MKTLPRHCLFLMVLAALSLTSCKKKMPAEVIKPAEMENILYDYHLAQAVGAEYNGEERYKRELLLQYVFEKHHVTEAEFDSSMVWYTRNMEELDNIYKNLERRYDDANKNLARLYQDKQKRTIASGDTVELWNDRKMKLLAPSELANRLTFKFDADTTFHHLDKFVLRMNVRRLAKESADVYAGLTIGYKNDSTVAVTERVPDDGALLLSIRADTLDMERVEGFVYYKDSVSSTALPVVLQDIMLTRYHASREELDAAEEARRKQLAKQDSTDVKPHKPAVARQPEKNDSVETVKTVRRRNPNDMRRQQHRD